MSRPGGNPGLEKYQFQQKYDWDESCTEVITLRIPPSMKKAIKDGLIKNWAEVCRQAIAAELEKGQSPQETRTETTEQEQGQERRATNHRGTTN